MAFAHDGQYSRVVEKEFRLNSAYVPKDALELERTADDSAWDPCEFVREHVKNFDQIEVELIDKKTRLSIVREKLIEAKLIGLVVMGPTIHRHSKPSLIVLSTKNQLFIIDPNDLEKGIQFLRVILNDTRLQFWTTNGLQESDCLYHNYGIDLTEAQAKCCTGVHIHLIRSMQCMPCPGRLFYSTTASARCRTKVRIEKFEELVEIWLDICKEEIPIDAKQFGHLNTRPLNLTALNLIKKRCVLVIPLAAKLEYYSWVEAHTMSKQSFVRLINCTEKLRREVLTNLNRQDDRVDVGFYAHLNCGPMYIGRQ